ncbi:phosphatidylglycerophosphatase A [Oleiagrimonas sp. MCCC 1A03011]|uniref:phosphatidylglycerophosphatase A family protein n=1 Tax=Oleiagrimonas sp. MCCC 1A03011 TaxID=1926883 RepID=UPI000DC20B88|nr:phosphatidylglycerophosphatase A [Oleiagrimonas sp. MCCC 1A03011]RAP58502.1 phosphatidylglycerophosphatase A [Oleiagrimonas sp. MCCC 1A03011]
MNARTSLTPTQRTALLTHPAGWLALFFGAGLAPVAQGTVGSALAILPWWFMRDLAVPAWGLVLIVGFAIGLWACGESGRRIGVSDHRALVWDEVIGQWIALLPALAAPWWAIVAGFALFRFFDVLKPWPIRWLDARVKGGIGVMLDDVVAGVFAAVILAVALHFLA